MMIANKFGMLSAIIISVMAVGFVFSSSTTTPNSIQDQGQEVIEKTTEEILEVPIKVEKLTEKSIDKIKEIPDNIPEDFSEAVTQIKEIPPELPPVVEKTLNQEKLSAQVSIQPGASISECDTALNCLSPYYPIIYKGGEVLWTNNDESSHTMISGNPQEGPNGVFDSGLIAPRSTFSQVFEIEGEYEFFCVLHPWIQGKVFVEEA